MLEENPWALRLPAVTCDALARAEQTFLLLPVSASPPGGGGTGLRDLPDEEFWLLPDFGRPPLAHLTDPYRDRRRSLDELRHRDGRMRLQHYAVGDQLELLDAGRVLRWLDGEHTLSRTGVRSLLAEGVRRLALLLVRVHRLPEALLVTASGVEERVPRPGDGCVPGRGNWVTLPAELPTRGTRAVLDGASFLERKARLLQRLGVVRAV